MVSGFSLSKLFHKRGARQPRDISPGMRYKQLSQLGSVWVVKRLVRPAGQGLPHVMIEREGEGGDTRVIAVAALKDTSAYRYLPPEVPSPEPKDFA